MKLLEIAQLIKPNSFDKKGTKMKLPDVYKEKDAGTDKKVTAQTVIVKNTNTGQVIGRRTIYQKKI